MNGFYVPDQMYLEDFGGEQIFRPRLPTELAVRAEAEIHLRSSFDVGRYFSDDEINSILQHNFSFYSNILDELLPQISSIDLLKFVLFQFELYTRIDRLQRERLLNPIQDARWALIGPNLRRSAKYLAERLCFVRPDGAPRAEERLLLQLLEKVWICAEQVIELYMKSDIAFITFPSETALEIFPPGEELYLDQEILRDCPDIKARMRLDNSQREHFVPDAPILSDLHEHDRVIGEDVRAAIGLNYRNAMGVLAHFVRGCRASPRGFPIPFVHRANAIERFAEFLQFPPEAVERALEGFSISRIQMEREGRELWRPNREYRAYRRAFFEVPHESGEHLIFSPAMAEEAFALFSRETVFGKFPAEWRSETVNRGLGRLSNLTGRWFERVVEDNCRSIGFVGLRSIDGGVGQGEQRIRIPENVGEIDLVVYSELESLLLVIECKLVRYSFEPRYFRDDIHDFALARRSHANKFRRKVQWVRDNSRMLCNALASTVTLRGMGIAPNRIAAAIVTLYPSMATCFIEDMPCVSVAEMMVDYQSLTRWPYELGVWQA